MVPLTAEQQQVVDHGDGMLRVSGRAGTGKTTALAARYLRLAKEVRPSAILVLCRNAAAARRFRDAVLPDLAGGFDALPVTSFRGLAFDIVGRSGERPRVLSAAEQRALVRDLLATDTADDWPTLHGWLGRAAFGDEVAAAILHWQGAARVGLGAAHESGVAWTDMAVLVRRPRRARAVSRALARHGIPTAPPETGLADEPIVSAVVDMLRWAAGDEDAFERLLSSPLSGLDA